MNRMISYVRKDTWIHRLSGVTKLVFFLLWCITSALTYDTRILLVMIAVTIAVFVMSKTTWKQVAPVFRLVLFFMVLNVAAIFLLRTRAVRSTITGRCLRRSCRATI